MSKTIHIKAGLVALLVGAALVAHQTYSYRPTPIGFILGLLFFGILNVLFSPLVGVGWGAIAALAFPAYPLGAVALLALTADLVLMPCAAPVTRTSAIRCSSPRWRCCFSSDSSCEMSGCRPRASWPTCIQPDWQAGTRMRICGSGSVRAGPTIDDTCASGCLLCALASSRSWAGASLCRGRLRHVPRRRAMVRSARRAGPCHCSRRIASVGRVDARHLRAG